jgi:hypothetical protein
VPSMLRFAHSLDIQTLCGKGIYCEGADVLLVTLTGCGASLCLFARIFTMAGEIAYSNAASCYFAQQIVFRGGRIDITFSSAQRN